MGAQCNYLTYINKKSCVNDCKSIAFYFCLDIFESIKRLTFETSSEAEKIKKNRLTLLRQPVHGKFYYALFESVLLHELFTRRNHSTERAGSNKRICSNQEIEAITSVS